MNSVLVLPHLQHQRPGVLRPGQLPAESEPAGQPLGKGSLRSPGRAAEPAATGPLRQPHQRGG